MVIGMILETFSIGLVIRFSILCYNMKIQHIGLMKFFYLFERDFNLMELYIIGLSILLLVFTMKTIYVLFMLGSIFIRL